MIDKVFFRRLGFAAALMLAWACMPAQVRGEELKALASFDGTNGSTPTGRVIFDANGNLYGTARYGGTNSGGFPGNGTVWELTKGSSTITALASFNGTNGANPDLGVTFDAHGNLYGTAFVGGASNQGTVWELPKGSGSITALASFEGTNGSRPTGGVTFDATGNLYGTATIGGASNFGTVWELPKGSNTITALASFNGTNGSIPLGGVTLDANGNLYGTTLSDSAHNFGTVWEFQTSPTVVPEPSSLVLGLLALVLMPLILRRLL